MKRIIRTMLCAAVSLGLSGMAFGQTTAKEDIKDAGRSTKRAAKKTGSAVKKGTKKAVNKSAAGVEKGAEKVKEKTNP
jgi:hypothetical protein